MLIFVKYGIILVMESSKIPHSTEQPPESIIPRSNDISSEPIDNTIPLIQRSQLIGHVVSQLKGELEVENQGLYEHYCELLARSDHAHGGDERDNTNLPHFYPPTPEQERELFGYIEDGFTVIAQHPTIENITEEEKRKLTLMAEARDVLTLANIGLVHTAAGKHLSSIINTTLTYRDLISEGTSELLHVIDKFRPSEGNKFSTFATLCLARHIHEYILQHRDNIRTPLNKWQDYLTLRGNLDTLSSIQRGERPTNADFGAIGSTRRAFEMLEGQCLRRTASLDAPAPSGSETKNYSETLPDQQPSPHEVILARLTAHSIIAGANINERQRFILGLHHGLTPDMVDNPTVTTGGTILHYSDAFGDMQNSGKDTLTNREIAELLKCTPQNIGGLLRTIHGILRQTAETEN